MSKHISLMAQSHAEMEEKRLMSILTSQCSLTAQFNSTERYMPSRCAESTREAILNKLRDWVESTPTSDPDSFTASCFWLHGGAGSGKSAIAQSLAEQLSGAGNLAASFFFFSIDASRNKGYRLFPTIIYNLTRINTAYEKKVIDQLRRNQDVFSRPLDQQVKVLFTDPLFTLHAEGVDPSTLPRLIVIDALDECVHDKQIQCDILAIIAQTILSGLPYPFRFLVTSRPEGYISRTFEFNKYIRRIPVQKYDLSKDPDASQDIRTLLQQEFTRICQTHPLGSGLENNSWPSENELVALIDRSSGHFVYPASVIQYIASPEHSPDERLKITLGLKPREPEDQPFSHLDTLYMMILMGVEGPGLTYIKRAFSILYLISGKVGCFSVYHSGSYRIIEDMLLLRPGDLDLLFDPLRSLVAQDNGEVDLDVLQTALFDYLLDPERSRQFAFSKRLCHESAALYMHNANILTKWLCTPAFMYFAYHCYLAQPIQDERLLRFLENLNILYADRNSTPSMNANTNTCRYQNERPLLAVFMDEGKQESGAKSIFYILRMLSLLSEFRGGQDLHEIHCTKIAQFYSGITAQGSSGRGQADVNLNQDGSVSASMSNDRPGPHAALDEMIRTKLKSWQPTEDILRVITAAKDGPTSTAARDTLISREHAVFASFACAQHLSNSFYRQQQSTLILPSDSVAHSYHVFSVGHADNPSLMVLVHTYSRGGTGALDAVVKDQTEGAAGPGAVSSARGFNVTQLGEKGFKESVNMFLDDHIEKVEKELAQAIDDQFENKFKF